jgi:hypothetical protein
MLRLLRSTVGMKILSMTVKKEKEIHSSFVVVQTIKVMVTACNKCFFKLQKSLSLYEYV